MMVSGNIWLYTYVLVCVRIYVYVRICTRVCVCVCTYSCSLTVRAVLSPSLGALQPQVAVSPASVSEFPDALPPPSIKRHSLSQDCPWPPTPVN